ncbi:OpgC family protein [Siculibacillus lacustris]|nr:OpgC domain-containing protein [Siculibacillus lacustris]
MAWARFLAGGAAIGREPAASIPRDRRLDVMRGLALIVIFIDHMPGNLVAAVMPHAWGFCDAAELFVFLSGMSAAWGFGRTIDRLGPGAGGRKILARLGTIYVWHLIVFLAVVCLVAGAMALTGDPAHSDAIDVDPLLDDTIGAAVAMLTLTYQPNYLNILPLYLVLLAAYPLIHVLVCRSPLLALVLSAALWRAAAHFQIDLPAGDEEWFFNPLAWQMIFTFGVVAGRAASAGLALPHGRAARAVDALAIAVVVFAAAVKLAEAGVLTLPALAPLVAMEFGADKTNLDPARLVHFAALAWLFLRAVPPTARRLDGPVARRLAAAGRHSLEVFAVGTILAVAGQIVMIETAFDPGVQLATCAVGIAALIGLGAALSRPAVRATPTAASASEAPNLATVSSGA